MLSLYVGRSKVASTNRQRLLSLGAFIQARPRNCLGIHKRVRMARPLSTAFHLRHRRNALLESFQRRVCGSALRRQLRLRPRGLEKRLRLRFAGGSGLQPSSPILVDGQSALLEFAQPVAPRPQPRPARAQTHALAPPPPAPPSRRAPDPSAVPRSACRSRSEKEPGGSPHAAWSRRSAIPELPLREHDDLSELVTAEAQEPLHLQVHVPRLRRHHMAIVVGTGHRGPAPEARSGRLHDGSSPARLRPLLFRAAHNSVAFDPEAEVECNLCR